MIDELRRFFASLPLFPTLCFMASSGTLVDGGAGGGGDAGGNSGGDGGSGDESGQGAGGDEDAADSEVDVDADAGADDADADVDGEEDGEGEEAAVGEGRAPMPKAIREGLNKLRETDPKLADALRKEYYTAGDFKQVFATVQGARDARDLIENFGGADGIGALKKDSDDYAAELRQFAMGEPAAIDALVKDFPGSLAKLTPYAVSKLKSVDEVAYTHLAANLLIESLAEYNVLHSVTRLGELIADGKQKEAATLQQEMQKWLRDTAAFAKSKPTPKAGAEGGDSSLSKERQEFENQKAQEWGTATATASLDTLNQLLDSQLNRLLATRKGLKLTKEQRQSFLNEARGIVASGLGGLQGYRDRVQGFINAKDRDGLLRFMRGKATTRINGSTLIVKAAKRTWAARGWATARIAGRPGGGAAPGTGGATQVSAKPATADIDWSKDRNRQRFMAGEATLKSGKVVKWKW